MMITAVLAHRIVTDRGVPQPGGGARTLPLTDPDGNRVVLTGQ